MEARDSQHNQSELLPGAYSYAPESSWPVPNTVSVVEDFFQAPLNEDLIKTVRQLPEDQYEHLWRNGDRVSRAACIAAGMRGWRSEDEAEKDYKPHHSGEIAYNDSLLEAGVKTHVTATPGLEQIALYADRALIRDSVFAPMHLHEGEADRQTILANRLGAILPIADLIRNGQLLPISTTGVLTEANNIILMTAVRDDPFIHWVKRSHPEIGKHIQAINQRIDDPPKKPDTSLGMPDVWVSAPPDVHGGMRGLVKALQPLYPHTVSAKRLRKVLVDNAKLSMGQYSPITGDKDLIYHLKLCTQLSTEDPATRTLPAVADFAPAVRFELPAPYLPLTSIAKLRQNEEVFTRLRQALHEHSQACAEQALTADGFENYQRIAKQQAEAIIQPAYDELMTWYKQAQRKKWGAMIVGGTIGFGLDYLKILGGKQVGQGIGAIAGREATAQLRDTAAATQILKSLL